MKKAVIFVIPAVVFFGLLFSLIFNYHFKTVEKKTQKIEDWKKEFNRFKERVEGFEKELDVVYDFHEKDPKFLLFLLDHELDLVEDKGKTRGSFTDYFVVLLADALKAGAPKNEVFYRVDRLIVLAEQKKFLSSYEENLFMEGGSKAVREYINDWLGESQSQKK